MFLISSFILFFIQYFIFSLHIVSPLVPSWILAARSYATLYLHINQEKLKLLKKGLCLPHKEYSLKNVLLSLDQVTPIVKEFQVEKFDN